MGLPEELRKKQSAYIQGEIKHKQEYTMADLKEAIDFELEQVKAEKQELEKIIASQKITINNLQKQLEQHNKFASRDYKLRHDYLDYEEDRL